MKELTEKDYKNYLKVVESIIKNTEQIIPKLDMYKKVINMTFEEWLEFQKKINKNE